MSFNPLFLAIESSAFSIWLRESLSLFALPGILTLHTLAMGFLAGILLVVSLRLLGVAATIPKPALVRFFPLIWLAFWVNLVTGVCLLIAYPTKALTNPLFYVKLGLIAAALALVPGLRSAAMAAPAPANGRADRKTRLLAITSVLLWTGAIVAGRLLAYTYSRLLADD